MEQWEEVHYDSTVVDLHTHGTLKSIILGSDLSSSKKKLFGGFLERRFERKFYPFSNRVTFPKINEGGVDVILSTAYTLEQGWIDDISLIRWLFWLVPSVRKAIVDPTYFDATINMIDEMESQMATYNSRKDTVRKAILADSVANLNKGLQQGDICVVHAVEGGHCLNGVEGGRTLEDQIMSTPEGIEEELLNNLEYFFNRGVAYLTLAHFYPNHIAYPVFPYPEYAMTHMKWKKMLGKWDMNEGLTALGEKIVEKMLELGMLIDIVHSTPNARKRIYEIADHHNKKSCIISSHTGCFSINRDPYNLEDWEIKWIADNGGVVGIIFMNYWISPVDSGLGLKHIEHSINHAINVGGEHVVGIGTDFDGFTDPPDEIVDMSELPRLTKYLMSLGYSDTQLRNILGGNALRVLREGWGKKE